jgi:hypothetical protein
MEPDSTFEIAIASDFAGHKTQLLPKSGARLFAQQQKGSSQGEHQKKTKIIERNQSDKLPREKIIKANANQWSQIKIEALSNMLI